MHDKKAYAGPVAAQMGEKLSAEEKAEFTAHLRGLNLKRLFVVAIITVVGEAAIFAFLITNLLLSVFSLLGILLLVQSVLMIGGIAAYLYLQSAGDCNGIASDIVCSVFLLAYLFCQLLIGAQEYLLNSTIYSYLLGLIPLCVAVVLSKARVLLYVVVYYAAFQSTVLGAAGPAPLYTLVCAGAFSAVTIACSYLFYNLHLNGFIASRELQSATESLNKLSTIDHLTGVNNRRGFEHEIQIHWEACLRRQSPLSIMLVDIDAFKRYGDHYGNAAGDLCITDIASCIATVFQRKLDLYARFGGDEFIVAVQDMSEEEAAVQANRLREQVNAAHILHAFSPIASHVTVSIGLASQVPVRPGSYENLAQNAYEALAEARRSGGNCVRVYAPKTDAISMQA